MPALNGPSPIEASVRLPLLLAACALASLPGCVDGNLRDPSVPCETEADPGRTTVHCNLGDQGARTAHPGCGDGEAGTYLDGYMARGTAHVTVSPSDADGANPGAPAFDRQLIAGWDDPPERVALPTAAGYLLAVELTDFNGDLTLRVECTA